jgi:RHS repeat-associated protein
MIWLAWEIRWLQNADGSVDNNSVVYVAAMEYRYDSARGRYRVQARDHRDKINGVDNPYFLHPYDPATGTHPAAAGVWSDYGGDEIHGDYGISIDGAGVTANNTMAFEPGLAQSPWNGAQPPTSANTAYAFGNLVGTAERMSIGAQPARRVVYTAFGEPVFEEHAGAFTTRYGYAAAWGYQGSAYTSGDPLADLGWLHVGARYYDPSSGRFVQRDPIGIAGGLNVYEYVTSSPVAVLDPSGLDRWYVDTGIFGHHYVIVENPDGRFNGARYIRIDFWGRDGTGWLFDKGVVSQTPFRTLRPPPGNRIASDLDEDQALVDQVDKDSASPPGYNTLLYNCQHYSAYIGGVGLDPFRRYTNGWKY